MADVTETPPIPLNSHEEALLRALGRVMVVLPRAVDIDMVRDQQLSLSEYTALMYLSEAPDRLMRMNELAGACDLSLSGISRIVGRLETRALVRRVRSDQDARGWNAVLTDAGLARLEQAWPTNLNSVRRHLFDHLEGVDLPLLTTALERVLAAHGCHTRSAGSSEA